MEEGKQKSCLKTCGCRTRHRKNEDLENHQRHLPQQTQQTHTHIQEHRRVTQHDVRIKEEEEGGVMSV